ncbi:Polyol transporter 5 [Linum grandiflorum]
MPNTSRPNNFTVCLSIIASQSTLLFGFAYDTCIILLTATTAMVEDLKLTEHQLDHFRDDAKWALFLACAVSGFSADFIGRRSTLVVSGYLSCLGFLFMASAPSYGLLITGRVISLAGIGFGISVTPLYIGEIASPLHRGFLNTIPDILSILGLWLAAVIRAALGHFSPSLQWRILVGVGIIPSLILATGIRFMPESPCWSIMRGRIADTKATLRRTLKTTSEVDARLSALRTAARVPSTASENDEVVEVPPNRHILAIWREVIRPRSFVTTLVKNIISIFTIHFLQQATGIDLLTKEAIGKFGFELPNSTTSFKFGWGLTPILCGKFFPIFFPLFFSDVLKRKTILAISLTLTGISLVIINVSLFATRHENFYAMTLTAERRMNLWTTVVFFGSFCTGLGPITWVHTSEVLPFKVRAQVIGIVVMLNRMMSFDLSFLKPLMDQEPEGLLYWFLTFLFIIGMALFARFFIESKGQSLEALDELPSESTIELN